MAENRILIRFQGKGEKPLIAAINKLAKAQERLTRATKQSEVVLDKNGKALRRNTQRLGGMGNALATVRSKLLVFNFAMGMGIRQLISMSAEAARFEAVATGFVNLGEAAGFTSDSMNQLRDATRGTVNDMELMKQANNALVLGVADNSDEMSNLFEAARRLGAALGKDTLHSVESLVTGIGRQSRLMLDNLGIVVKSEEAYKKYALRVGTSSDKLTDHQKKLAFTAEAMEKINEAVDALGDDFLTNDQKIARATTTYQNLQTVLGAKVAPVIGTTSQFYLDWLGGVDTGNHILKRGSHTMLELEESARDLQEQLDRSFLINADDGKMVSDLTKKIEGNLNSVTFALELMNTFQENNPDLFLFNPEKLGEVKREIQDIASQIQKISQDPLISEALERHTKKVQDDVNMRFKGTMMLVDGLSSSLASATLQGQHMGEAIVNSLKSIAVQIASKMALYSVAGLFMPSIFAGSAFRFALGLSPVPVAHKGGHIGQDGSIQRFATGGVVQGQDNVPILAQAGEYVMSRSAVDAVGLETMNRINAGGGAGGVNISFTGNVMSQDFIENEAIPQIKEAIRRGADIGVS
tara:strand:+ start:45 stop:1790 length:1746 start_codon:yes stop_codon:yes gene_type:complete